MDNPIGELDETIQLVIIAGILGGIGIAGYYLYQYYQDSASDPNAASNGGDASILNTAVNNTLSVGGPSSETYTAAVGSIVTSPWASIKSILGID
jgi:hypothetical protein